MMKTLIVSGAALLIAGAATAAEVNVVVDPGANVIVRHVEWNPALVGGGDDDGMLSADEVGGDRVMTDAELEALFGFDPAAVIYIYDDEATGVRVIRQDLD